MQTTLTHINQQYLGYFKELLTYVQSLPYRHHRQQTKFVLFGRGRSGSTLLTEMLNSSPDIYCDKEILNRPVSREYQYIEARRKLHRTRAFGFKLLSYQIKDILNPRDARAFLHHIVEDMGYKMVFMSRENLLRQTLSKHYAQFRNSWHEQKQLQTRPKMKVDIPLLIKHMDEGAALGELENRWIDGLHCLRLGYEKDLSTPERQEAFTNELADFLEIPRFKPRVKMQKITPKNLEDFVDNHDELAAAITKTSYAPMLAAP